jgi:hypothetical protein
MGQHRKSFWGFGVFRLRQVGMQERDAQSEIGTSFQWDCETLVQRTQLVANLEPDDTPMLCRVRRGDIAPSVRVRGRRHLSV